MTRARRVLVVDEDVDIRCALAESLIMEGDDVDMAANGLEALEVATIARPDAIVLEPDDAHDGRLDVSGSLSEPTLVS